MKEQIVIIEWQDAWSGGDKSLKKAAKSKPIETHTVGWLLNENEEGVTIAVDIYPAMPKVGALTNFIPWGMINEYTKVEWMKLEYEG